MRTKEKCEGGDQRGFGQGKWSQPWGSRMAVCSARVSVRKPGGRWAVGKSWRATGLLSAGTTKGRGSFSSSAHALGKVVYLALSSSLSLSLWTSALYMCHRQLGKKPLRWISCNEFWEERTTFKKTLRVFWLIAESTLPWLNP